MIGGADLDGSHVDFDVIHANAPWLAADDQYVYWSNADPTVDSIGRANVDGTGADPNFIRDPGAFLTGVAVDSHHIYWARVAPGGPIGGTIARANLDGTGIKRNFISNAADTAIYGVAVDARHIYWAHNYWIGRANLNGTGVHPQFISEYNTGFWGLDGGVAVGGGHVYWSHEDLSEKAWIARAKTDGSKIQPTFQSAAGPAGVSQVAADSRHIYWEGTHGIARADLDGTNGDPAFIPVRLPAFAVSSSHIFWGSPERGSIKVHRPIRHKRRGTATLPLEVFGPGKLALSGKGLKSDAKSVDAAPALENLPVKPTGHKKRELRRRGRVRVKAEVAFTLTGGGTRTRTKHLKLVQR